MFFLLCCMCSTKRHDARPRRRHLRRRRGREHARLDQEWRLEERCVLRRDLLPWRRSDADLCRGRTRFFFSVFVSFVLAFLKEIVLLAEMFSIHSFVCSDGMLYVSTLELRRNLG